VTAAADFNPHSPQALRAKKRLRALGIDPDAADLEDVRQWYEARREYYINLAEEGLHMAPTHALHGMSVDALKTAFGWTDLPEGWSSAQVEWPDYAERLRGARGK
jgi:hypothetical protein